MKSRRLLAVSLCCVAICGCQSAGVGNPLPPSGGLSTILTYGPASGGRMGILIYGKGDYPWEFTRDPTRDNDPHRPANTPASYVAWTTQVTLIGGVTYDADLMKWSTLTNKWEFADTIDPFPGNELVLITPDN